MRLKLKLLNPAAGTRFCAGFSLIEMIGVLAVGLILLLALAWVSTKGIDTAVSNQEGSNLQNFANALQNNVLRSRYIPGATNWYQIIATELGLNTNAVLQTSRRVPRVFMIDPNFQVGTNSTAVLPYTQSAGGSTNQPQSPRLLILASLSAALPASGTSSTNFTALWNAADGFLPTNGSFSGWSGRFDDLKIQRINLGPLFTRLQLANYLSGTNQGRYTIDGQGPITVTTNGVNAYFIQNSVLTLLSGTTNQAEVMLSRDFSFFYVAQVWRNVPYIPDFFTAAQSNGPAAGLANMIAIAAANFVKSPFNINASGGATPPSVLNSMSNFMSAYTPYAAYAAAYATTNSGNWPVSGALYTSAKNAQTAVQAALDNLRNNLTPGDCTNAP